MLVMEQQKENHPQFVFIVGTPRSGGSVTLASLDGHPDILAWPYEFTYFPFFYQIAGERKKVPVSELNQKLTDVSLQYFSKRIKHGGGLYDKDSTKSSGGNDFNIGDLDFQLFLQSINAEKEKSVNAVEYLTYLFECLKYSNRQYRDKSVKYYLLLTTARGFDWHDEDLLKSSMFLYSYRDAEDSYASIREKYLKDSDLNVFLSLKRKKSSLYWLENYRRISRYGEKHINAVNFMVIPLKDLQKETEEVLKHICSFLKIEPHPNIFNLTIMGNPYKGNAREGNLNAGKIAKRTSKPSVPLCSFEQRIFALLDLFDFPGHKKRDLPSFGFIEMIRKAFSSAFIELPGDKVWKGGNPVVTRRFIKRLTIFCKLCGIYTALKNVWLAKRFIRKGNKHIINNPFWSEK